ncbi:hypothetical protein HanIR_Chr04g0157471 [Helianthus annuus]|nr:hypothetical protein HanIR_Chr04g0157471 [Helianthus annuus]
MENGCLLINMYQVLSYLIVLLHNLYIVFNSFNVNKPFKWGDSITLDKHVFSTLVIKVFRLPHSKCQYPVTTRISSHL